MSPTVGNDILTLARFAATEERLISVKKQLSSSNCIITELTIERVHLNDRRAKMLADSIEANSTIQVFVMKKCKLRVDQF